MPKQLTLKPRAPKDGRPTWHDLFLLDYALAEMVKGKPVTKVAVQMSIAEKITIEQEETGHSSENIDTEVTIELRNAEARILWKGLEKLKPEQFGRDIQGRPSVPPLGYLNQMLHDIAAQLDEKMPEPDEDD